MVILGAGGHAKEILSILKRDYNFNKISFFDNLTPNAHYPSLFNEFERVKSYNQLGERLSEYPDFIIGVGNPSHRHSLWEMAIKQKGRPYSLISKTAVISDEELKVSKGISLMDLVFISSSVSIGECSVVNCRANVHHDVKIGDFTEIGPGALILGKSKIGNNTFIGAGAIILPKIVVGNNCIIGAGAVVTKNVSDNQTLKGNPAR